VPGADPRIGRVGFSAPFLLYVLDNAEVIGYCTDFCKSEGKEKPEKKREAIVRRAAFNLHGFGPRKATGRHLSATKKMPGGRVRRAFST